jgi:ParB family transcriptional regulator, chromosome partitioning protein
MSNQFYNDSIFWIELDKIKPNPYQPRRDFNIDKLNDLAESIRQYGVLQPLVVTRREVEREDGGLTVEYELIAGERRLRASREAGLAQVPVIIRSGEDESRMKLELAIIENIQREDLNPIDRARAFDRLVKEFGFKHGVIANKIGKSREYVANSVRLLALPEDIQNAVSGGLLSEGHARPILMLNDKPEEQITLFKEIIYKKITVREAEGLARRVAQDKVRKASTRFDPEILELENKLSESLGTRVQIERKDVGGKVLIDFFSADDLRVILGLLKGEIEHADNLLNKFIASSNNSSENESQSSDSEEGIIQESNLETNETAVEETEKSIIDEEIQSAVDEAVEEAKVANGSPGATSSSGSPKEEDLYSIKNFSI